MNIPDHTRPDLLAILGHTAGGKTALAVRLASLLDGEIISADSRQVYRGMDIGTGKDLEDYRTDGKSIRYHLIDIAKAGERYSLFDFQRDFHQAYLDIRSRGKLPVLCGGTGLYAESVLKGYSLAEAPVDPDLRKNLENLPDSELVTILESLVPLHNRTDLTDRNRLIRAIEVARASRLPESEQIPAPNALVFCQYYEPETRRKRITERLTARLKSGMIEEVQTLLQTISPDDLIYYGLEYKYLTQYCLGQISYDEMFASLNTAIHQFAKRQMTWFRGMERRGIPVNWLPGELSLDEKVNMICRELSEGPLSGKGSPPPQSRGRLRGDDKAS